MPSTSDGFPLSDRASIRSPRSGPYSRPSAGVYRAQYAAGYAVPHPDWYQGPCGVPMQVWVYMPSDVTMNGIHDGAIVRRIDRDKHYRVLWIRSRPGTQEAEAVLEPIDESWIKRVTAPILNLQVCDE